MAAGQLKGQISLFGRLFQSTIVLCGFESEAKFGSGKASSYLRRKSNNHGTSREVRSGFEVGIDAESKIYTHE